MRCAGLHFSTRRAIGLAVRAAGDGAKSSMARRLPRWLLALASLGTITTGQASQRTLEAGAGEVPGAAPMTVVAQPEQMQVQLAVVVAVQLHAA